jgi:hypothetical protein
VAPGAGEGLRRSGFTKMALALDRPRNLLVFFRREQQQTK